MLKRFFAWIGRLMRRRNFIASTRTVVAVSPPPPPPPPPPLSLGTLAMSATSFTAGSSSSGTITGATALSTIVASGLPTGLTINGAARTWAWDGTGTASTGSLTLTETLAGYGNSPHANVIGYTIAAANTLATPTNLRNSSALGAVPVVLAFDDAEYVVGDFAQLQFATDNTFTTITQSLVFFLDGVSVANLDESIGLIDPSGPYSVRARTARDNDSGATTVSGLDPKGNAVSFPADVSAWSNIFSDTILVTTTVLDATKQFFAATIGTSSLYGANLKNSGVDAGAVQPVGTTTSVPVGAKYYSEHKITAFNRFLGIGIADGTFDFVNTENSPGAVSKGAGLQDNGFILPSAAHSIPTEALNQLLQMCVKRTSTSSVTVWIGVGNTWANGDPSAETGGETVTLNADGGGTHCYGYVFADMSTDVLESNFGQVAFTFTKPTGSTAWS